MLKFQLNMSKHVGEKKTIMYFKYMGHNSYKYTWAPQTVHITPVMNILKGYFYLNYIILFSKKRIKEANVKF